MREPQHACRAFNVFRLMWFFFVAFHGLVSLSLLTVPLGDVAHGGYHKYYLPNEKTARAPD